MSEGLPLRNPRHLARTFAVLGVYQWLTNGTCPADIELQLPDILRDARGDEPLEIDDEDFARCDRELFVELLNGAVGDAEGVSALFEAHTDRAAKMLSPVERAILMVGTVELRSHPENPYPVVINEAVELAKDFGGTNGYRYVNGVLDKLAAQLRPDEVAAAAARRKGRGCGRKAKAGPA